MQLRRCSCIVGGPIVWHQSSAVGPGAALGSVSRRREGAKRMGDLIDAASVILLRNRRAMGCSRTLFYSLAECRATQEARVMASLSSSKVSSPRDENAGVPSLHHTTAANWEAPGGECPMHTTDEPPQRQGHPPS